MGCFVCNKLLKKNASKFCSSKCQQEYDWKNRKAEFESCGFWIGVNSEVVIARRTKRYLKETRGVECEICHNTEWMGQEIPLILDHVDGNSSNNELSNLRLVCGNCDMQLPTYKSKNRGHGRFIRRQRYAEGKSY